MSELDFSDSFGVLDFGVPDFAGLPEPVEIPEFYELPPELVLPGFAPFDEQMLEPQPFDQQLDDQLVEVGFLETVPDHQPGSFDLAAKARGHLKGLAKEGIKRRREIASAATEKAVGLDPDRAAKAADVGRAAFGKAKRLGAFAKNKQDALVAKAGASRPGEAVGRGARRVGAELQDVAGLSAPSDALRAKNGIAELAALVEAQPDDPYAYLWLAEALKTLERDTRVYVVARALANPTSLATRHLLKTGASIGAEPAVPASEQMLRRAHALADHRLKQGFDAHALHVIARVYLAKGSPEAAIRPATLALRDLSHPGCGEFFFTLGRAYLAAGQLPSARRAAERSIESGTTLGYELLADLLFSEDGANAAKERHHEYVELLARVDRADRTSYYGVDRSGSAAVKAVLESQKAKLADSVERGKAGVRAVKAELKRRRERP